MRHLHAAVAAAAAALLAGCDQPLLSAQLEVPEVRITTAPQAFPDASLATTGFCTGAAGCLSASSQYDIGGEVPMLNEKGVDVDLRLTDVELELVTTGPGVLDGIEAVRIVLVDPASAGTTVVASYVKPPGATPTHIAVSGNANLDLSSFLSGGKLDARVQVTYDLGTPPPAFTAQMTAGFSIVVTLDYGAFF